ncbi:DedA family protein [Paenibacillus spongiae]|uniref:DedA family protein n=1 Tax=Paenibacillus spongiae TaxID=2909671 RepID=A0ABY5SDI2_9BACL|nr:DedA family protein [Paenibacillus spongiae]UVI32017.1 DedA family protein [Paenibacillus spongiae]
MPPIEHWFEQFGYFVLFVGLIVDFILPFPAEPVMAYAGYLSYTGSMHLLSSVFVSFLGTSVAITISYGIGYWAGMPFIERYGKWLMLNPGRIGKLRRWFDSYGYKLLLVSFFIPAGRQFSGYLAGIVRIPFRSFAIYSYSGALMWVFVYVGVGHLVGPHWQNVLHTVKSYAGLIVLGICLLVAAIILIRRIGRLHKSGNSPSSKKTMDSE